VQAEEKGKRKLLQTEARVNLSQEVDKQGKTGRESHSIRYTESYPISSHAWPSTATNAQSGKAPISICHGKPQK